MLLGVPAPREPAVGEVLRQAFSDGAAVPDGERAGRDGRDERAPQGGYRLAGPLAAPTAAPTEAEALPLPAPTPRQGGKRKWETRDAGPA